MSAARCKSCNDPDPSGHAAHGMRCPKCWDPIPSLDDTRVAAHKVHRYKVGQRTVSYDSDVTRFEERYAALERENLTLRRALNRINAEDPRGFLGDVAAQALEAAERGREVAS